MTTRPYVLLSCAMSLDGRIDDSSPQRLVLSNTADLDRVDEVRAGCDAILVGATTVRRDDPGLAVRSERRRDERVAAGLPPTPLRATLTGSGRLDPQARFFRDGAEKIVYRTVRRSDPQITPATPPGAAAPAGAPEPAARSQPADAEPGPTDAARAPADAHAEPAPADADAARWAQIARRATVVDLDEPPPVHLLADLHRRGVRRLLVEGGTAVHTAFLTAGLVDELHLVVAPFFVGEAEAPAFVGPGAFPFDAAHRLTLAEVRQIGDVVLLRYLVPTATRL